jgi:predicted outer membrane repeat protein
MKNYGDYLTKLLLCTLLLTLFLSSTTVLAAIIKVPGDYTTIQTGIDIATAGDTVLVADGTYKGMGNKNLDFKGKRITVRSENGPEYSIIDCEGDGRGFYFHSAEQEDSVLSGFTIRNGNGGDDGGGIYILNSSPTITNCIVRENTARSGGGVSCDSSFPILTNCTIKNNTARSGGGINCDSCSPTIANCMIIDNVATEGVGASSGGGIDFFNSDFPTVVNCTIHGNTSFSGGGINISNSSPTITYCKITENTASNNGGGINGGGDSPTIINSIVSGNTAFGGHGGGIYSSSITQQMTVTNCTVSGNQSSLDGGGVYSLSDSPPITNSIFWDNMPDQIVGSVPPPAVIYSNVKGGYSGTGNIDADPQFVGNGDYHLAETSPCIDVGTSAGAPDYDVDGDQRPKGAGYDMGADEYSAVVSTLTADFTPSIMEGFSPLTVDFADQSAGFITTWYWDFGDGTISTVQNPPTHTYTQPAAYTVSLTVTGPAGADTETRVIQVNEEPFPWELFLPAILKKK